jgi:hypothetical protein
MTDTQREAFENFAYFDKGWRISANRADDGKFISYVRDDVQGAWEAWQAATARADMARKLGNSAKVKKQQTFGEAEDEFNSNAAKTGGMPYGTYGGYD